MIEATLPGMTRTTGCGQHIALVTETWPPEINGVSHTLARLVDGLCSRGYQVDVVRPRQGRRDVPQTGLAYREKRVAGLPIPFYPGLRLGLPLPGELERYWRNNRPALIHVATEGPLGMAAVAAARNLDIPLSSSFHTNFHAYSRHYGLGWTHGLIARHLRRLHNRCALTLVPTARLAARLENESYRNIGVLARGVDTALFNPARRSRSLRAQWGASDATLVVAYIGRLAAEKNIDLVLESYAAIDRARPDTRLLLVGDGPLRRSLQRRAPQHVYAGMRSGEDLAAHYASADLFLFPSMTETFGNVTLEALASGLPVLAYDLAAASELIINNRNGRLITTGDSTAFIDAATVLARRPAQIAAMRTPARSVAERLDWQTIHDGFAASLQRVIRAHAHRQIDIIDLATAPE